MKQVKELVKKREDIDAKMATLDLARKNTDDHRIATGEELSYSEKIDTVSNRIARLETLLNGG
jgi:bacillopeptidase F (M6 metalloprotease family)